MSKLRSPSPNFAPPNAYEGEACGECGNFTLVRNVHLHEVRCVRVTTGWCEL